MAQDKEPIAWITRGGKHIPIFADEPTEDEKKKDREIEESKKQAEENYNKTFSGSSGQLTAKVKKFMPLKQWNGQYITYFYALGEPDNDYRATNGLGSKVYDKEEQAISAAKRYVKRWEKK